MNQSSISVSINLRNKGLRNTAGSLIKGCVKDATTKLSIGSIPSNYQTIIYHHNSMKAFGSSQRRFYQQTKTQLDKTTIPDDSILNQPSPKNNVSHSTKGYGPFIAKQQRNWIPKSSSPGPGRYQFIKTAQVSSKRQKKKKNVPHFYPSEKNQNNFDNQKQLNNQKIQSPGPGEYQILEQRSTNNGWRSAFKSKINRCSYIPKNIAPGPGFYDIKQQALPKKETKQNKQNLYSPQKISPKKIFQIFQKQHKDQVPGPGSYEYQLPTFKPLYQRIKISGNFMISKKDRFNNQLQHFRSNDYTEEAPNMYSYNQKSAFDNQKRLLKWPCFMSESKRVVFNGSSKLGPSFLAKKVQDKKNYHFNIKGDWV